MINATPLLRTYSAWRINQLQHQNPSVAQQKQLRYLINRAQHTSFGKKHDFSKIKTVADYQKAVPIRKYEQFWAEFISPNFPCLNNATWPGLVPYFCVSSGTTSGSTKYIPYTSEMTASNTKAGLDLLVHHLHNKPDSQILAGKSFMLGGSTNLVKQTEGVYSGDLSGIAVKTMRSWVKPWYFPPAELALLENWEEKISVLAKESLKQDIRMLSGVPTWLLIFFDELARQVAAKQANIQHFFPKLEMLVYGGVAFKPYEARFNQIFSGSQVDFREVYPASEAFVALADRGPNQGLRMLLDHGNFFEFVPVDELESANPRRFWIDNVELGVNYAIILTTCAGLWSYVLGDTIEFVQLDPPRILITGRTAFYLSAFGEHLISEEVENAVNASLQQIPISVQEYTVGALFPQQEGDLGRHLFIIELAESNPENIRQISEVHQKQLENLIDTHLSELNEDYKAHRAEGFGLNPPLVKLVPNGTLIAWMKSRGKLGGQNKIPRIISKNEIFQDLIGFIAQLA